ncbi:hypothetical protein GOBAR_AA22136 [Gossypium barbadense]|uniref:Uncharacterized protein n=1 Tax=Gossypium barbadense TaxID=3634 RepID=A0A2P5X5A2_GOSBA|nr:hypothetical protein GOBAR_AA22136 [Gossypium barbadense]
MPRRRLRDLSIVQNTPNSEETNSEQQTAIGSSNVSETPDEPAKIQSNPMSLQKFKGRRPTLLKGLYELNPVERVKDRERVGTSSRQKQKFTHTVGSKSFACELSSGQKVGRLQLFDITHRKKDGSPMTFEAGEIMEKLKDKKAEYEAIASSDSFVNLEDIDNKIITEVLGPERLRDQMAQMQASTVEQIVQLKAEAASRKAEVQRKYEELQLQLKNEATTREAENTTNSSYSFRI